MSIKELQNKIRSVIDASIEQGKFLAELNTPPYNTPPPGTTVYWDEYPNDGPKYLASGVVVANPPGSKEHLGVRVKRSSGFFVNPHGPQGRSGSDSLSAIDSGDGDGTVFVMSDSVMIGEGALEKFKKLSAEDKNTAMQNRLQWYRKEVGVREFCTQDDVKEGYCNNTRQTKPYEPKLQPLEKLPEE